MKELDEVIKHLEFILDITESDLTDDIKNLKFVKKELEVLNLPHQFSNVKIIIINTKQMKVKSEKNITNSVRLIRKRKRYRHLRHLKNWLYLTWWRLTD